MNAESETKVRNALDLLQEAQSLVNQAAAELCSVDGFGREWSKSAKVHDAIKAYWHQVNCRRIGLSERAKGGAA